MRAVASTSFFASSSLTLFASRPATVLSRLATWSRRPGVPAFSPGRSGRFGNTSVSGIGTARFKSVGKSSCRFAGIPARNCPSGTSTRPEGNCRSTSRNGSATRADSSTFSRPGVRHSFGRAATMAWRLRWIFSSSLPLGGADRPLSEFSHGRCRPVPSAESLWGICPTTFWMGKGTSMLAATSGLITFGHARASRSSDMVLFPVPMKSASSSTVNRTGCLGSCGPGRRYSFGIRVNRSPS